MQRIFAHKIIYGGKVYDYHVAGISDDGRVELKPFNGETPSTVFVSGTIEIWVDDNGQIVYEPRDVSLPR